MSGFGRILADLESAAVRYVLIGGIAVIRHGVVRATRDIDAVVAQDEENLRRVLELIDRWGATRPDGSPLPHDAPLRGRVLNLATPHGDVDLLPDRPPAQTFAKLLERADVRRVDGVPAPIVSLADLVALKRAAGRSRDRADLESLREAHGELPELPLD